MINEALFSSKKMDWETPDDFFNQLNEYYNFTLDAAAFPRNAKCKKYFTPENNALTQDWSGENVWLNPPYGSEIIKFMEKAYIESLKGTLIVCLVPVRTDTRWFHSFVLNKAKVEFIKGRLKFKGAKFSAPFPCMLVIYNDKRSANEN